MIFMRIKERVEQRRHHREGWNEEMERGEEAPCSGRGWNCANQTPLLENHLDFAMDASRQNFSDAKERHWEYFIVLGEEPAWAIFN